jgi:hypothetical protein
MRKEEINKRNIMMMEGSEIHFTQRKYKGAKNAKNIQLVGHLEFQLCFVSKQK